VHVLQLEAEEKRTKTLGRKTLNAISKRLETEGYVVVADVISRETCELLATSVLEDTAAVREQTGRTDHEKRTGHGHLQLGLRRYAPYARADLIANPIIECVVGHILETGAWLGFYNGNINCPGSGYQPVHFDRPFSWRTPKAAAEDGVPWPPPTTTLSCSVALTDITSDTGPTEIYPGTHKETAVLDFAPGERVETHPELLAKWGPPKSMTIPKGGVCFRDPRMWHRGVSNPSDIPRPMIAVTYHAARCKHWRGLLIRGLPAVQLAALAENPALRVMEDGELGEGRLVFDASAEAEFSGLPNPFGIQRHLRFVDSESQVDHFRDAHLPGGARVVSTTKGRTRV
jgi:ectoine hydroxylase-related dioxygenase (phytanoyl-CoA dioxygenase family)